MATEVIKIVDPGEGAGHDYHSLALWEAGEQGDLTGVRNEIAVAKCRSTGGTADTTSVVIDGWTTDATRYIKIWTDPSESYRHAGVWDATKYRIECSVGNWDGNIRIIEDFVRIDGLQIYHKYAFTGNKGGIMTEWNSDSSVVYISNCIIKREGGWADKNYGIVQYRGTAHIWNNIIYDFNSDTNVGIYVTSQATSTGNVYNNTIYGCTTGIKSTYTTAIAKNNLIANCTVAASGTWGAGTDYNATNNAAMGYTVTGSGNTHDRLSQTFTFVGAADFHLAANDAGALGHGINLYNDANLPFQTDIDGQDRGGSGATWDIGADEYVALTAIKKVSGVAYASIKKVEGVAIASVKKVAGVA